MATAAILFNPLRYAKKLVEAGFTEKQAEVQAEAINEIVDEKLATKVEVEKVKSEMKTDIELVRRDIEAVRADLKRDIKELDLKIENVRADLKKDIELLKRDIVIKLTSVLGSMMVGGFAILSTLIVIFHK